MRGQNRRWEVAGLSLIIKILKHKKGTDNLNSGIEPNHYVLKYERFGLGPWSMDLGDRGLAQSRGRSQSDRLIFNGTICSIIHIGQHKLPIVNFP